MGLKMKILDDFLAEDDAALVSDILHDQRFPWYYLDNISGYDGVSETFQYGFYHLLYHEPDGGVSSALFEHLAPLWQASDAATGLTMYRARAGMSTNLGTPGVAHAHVDYKNPHTVVLYYLNDSDGDTVIYDGDPDSGLTVVERVPPKANRAVVFDGLRFHSSSYPTNCARRTVININYF